MVGWSTPVRGEKVAGVDGAPTLWLCGQTENDLYRVLTANGVRVFRFDASADAVKAADRGAGVLILADGYPAQPTEVPPAVWDEAAAKGLRLYVEFPAALPAVDVGKPQQAAFERAVVADDFFGDSLPRLRILGINELHFVPVAAANSHLVAARVAGFDTAVFGLAPATHPLLFEVPGRPVLVATTKLSHFVTGRYAPQDAWRDVWSGVLRWLCPEAKVLRLAWVPDVRPTYGPNDRLPADVEKQAFARGVEWFRRSGLLLHPTMKEAAQRAAAGNGLIPTPPLGAPVGDGSLGILEAPLSVIQLDGSQMISVAQRGDCTGESAMALAFGGRLLGDTETSRIAARLLDFYLFTSEARKNQWGDPNHGAYGLVAWGISSPAWYKANYGDDNARLMMGTLATAALTGQDRWDEPVMRCLLAQLRTTGQLGFRGDRLDLPELAGGWQPLFRRQIVSYSPHMEAYLWACYLWAYQQTKYELFLTRARTAIGMTMKQYPDGWRWTNGLAQEKARMLLPLAWLVRVEDTPEHRGWLRTVVDGLLQLQDSSGAIREELGAPGKGMFPPPGSNEAYGKGEAPLIQQNGDPVSDLLYTVNFALLGLHEAAAATGDGTYREAEDKLAKFLCRIQVRSDRHPSLDGGWFRAFDFKRWEPWGSNADAGWGAWAIEGGWTQGWITSVLGLRQMKTSLWDLTQRSGGVGKHFETLRREMLPDNMVQPPNH